MVINYQVLVNCENRLAELKNKKADAFTDDPSGKGDSTSDALTGKPVYYTNMVSNIHAGKNFYLDSLEENYKLSFSEDFASVMDEIEKEYKTKE